MDGAYKIVKRLGEIMESYIYIYYKRIPDGYARDDIEDKLEELLDGRGEVTGSGIGIDGGNIDIEIESNEVLDILGDIKAYLISCGFGADTFLDVNGRREVLK